MQAPASTTASPNAAIANNTACKPLDEIRGLTRFEKDVNEVISLYFEDIIKRLRRPLLDVLRKSKKGFRPFVIRLLVLGVDESSAKPYIVVFCPAQVQDIVENYFRRDTPKRLCQPGKDGPASFDVIVEGTPIQLTTSHHVHPTSINTGHSPTERLRYRDTPLKIDGIHGIRYATMGGYVVVVGKDGRLSIYGLTAGHSIVQDNLEGEIESEQASGEPNAGQNLFPDLITYEPSQVLQSAANQTMHNATYSPFNDAQEEIEWSGTAMVAPASFSTQACDRDWALLEAIADQPGSGIQDSKIVERYFVGEPRFGTLLADDEAKISLQPAFIGKLSRHPSFAILSYGSDFVRVHTITTRDSHSKPLAHISR
ncbi:hypothetical protein J4E90_003010 [Alternaria incomplexa]|uniref:uncharacterized protein n=1 Tax=Alternaria incomplexa TaxID=1187928 RepID=UPI002220A6D8|nr:uncharacterized protein J4E90_003010 [Alternaria incomplexa]KAI4918623.1 hypothetical protein J4E90_003010 [Alternaria incomplexa]